jgi:hypothetical protein
MNLLSGFRCAVAPHFHLPIDWSQRLRLGAIVEEQGCFVPQPPWRPANDEELAQLVRDPSLPAAPEDMEASLCLFKIPEHLYSGWWQLLEQSQGLSAGRLDGFDTFVSEVGEFLAFKSLPAPERARFDLAVSKPGQRSIRWDAESGRPEGLRFNLDPQTPWPLTDDCPRPGFWGGINLGNEAGTLVFINVLARQIHHELSRRFPDLPRPATLGELAGQFLKSFPDSPLVGLKVEPGEGYRLPVGGVIVDGSTLDREEPDIQLHIHHE